MTVSLVGVIGFGADRALSSGLLTLTFFGFLKGKNAMKSAWWTM